MAIRNNRVISATTIFLFRMYPSISAQLLNVYLISVAQRLQDKIAMSQ